MNPNHLAIALIVPLCLAGHRVARALRSLSGSRSRLVDRIAERAPAIAWNGAALVLVSGALVATLSRNGYVTGFGALLCGALLYLRGASRLQRLIFTSCATLLGLALVGALLVSGRGARTVTDRLGRTAPATLNDVRWTLLSDSLPMLAEHPWFGSGWGSWETRYEGFRSEEIADVVPEHLHNDPLECIVENGVIGCLPLAAALLLLTRNPRQQRLGSTTAPWLTCGIVGVMVASFFDFPFRIPAILLWWVFDVGIAVRLSGELGASNSYKTNGWT